VVIDKLVKGLYFVLVRDEHRCKLAFKRVQTCSPR
jgi:hypothetical protein